MSQKKVEIVRLRLSKAKKRMEDLERKLDKATDKWAMAEVDLEDAENELDSKTQITPNRATS